MGNLKQRHIFLATKAFPLKLKEGVAVDQRGRPINNETHNRNLPMFFEYIGSVMNNIQPSIQVRERIRAAKREYDYGLKTDNNILSSVDEFDSDYVGDSRNFTENNLNFVIPKTDRYSKEEYNDIIRYRNKLRRLNYVKVKNSASTRKLPHKIKQGHAYGVEIECYVPLSIVGVFSLENRCNNCNTCPAESRCQYDPNDFTRELTRFFEYRFKKMGIKNVQHTYDGSLNSNQDSSSEFRLYASTEFRVLCDDNDGFKNLELLCNLLYEIGAKVDESCGLHVHFDQRDVSFDRFLKNVERLNNSLFGLVQLVPKSRLKDDDTYCDTSSFNLPLINPNYDSDGDNSVEIDGSGRITKNVEEYLKEAVRKPTQFRHRNDVDTQRTFNEIYRNYSEDEIYNKYVNLANKLHEVSGLILSPNRYCAINTQCYVSHKTIEVRLHSGTIDYNKIHNWILLLKHVLNSRHFDSNSETLKHVVKTSKSIVDWMNLAEITNTDLRNYVTYRWTKFADTKSEYALRLFKELDERYQQRDNIIRAGLTRLKKNTGKLSASFIKQMMEFCSEKVPSINFIQMEIVPEVTTSARPRGVVRVPPPEPDLNLTVDESAAVGSFESSGYFLVPSNYSLVSSSADSDNSSGGGNG